MSRGVRLTKLSAARSATECRHVGLGAQRDFYYSKLREVEVLCQSHEGEQIPFLDKVPLDYD